MAEKKAKAKTKSKATKANPKTTKPKTTKAKPKTTKSKTTKDGKKTKSSKKAKSEPIGDGGIVIVEDDLSIDHDKVNEERKAYLEEARSQEAFD